MSGEVIVFGGTFDPVHNGHLAIAEQVLDLTGAGAVWFVPSHIPSLHGAPVASPEDRADMLRAAVVRHHGFVLRLDELNRQGVSYTVDTMHDFHRTYPHTEFRVLLGADAARSISRWDRADDLLAAEDFVIVNRTGVEPLRAEDAERLGFDLGRCELLRVDSPAVTATEVRRRAAAEESVDGLVPPPVATLIHARGLYGVRPADA